MKTCTKCGLQKPLEDFYRRPGVKDGRQAHCKACVKLWRKNDYDKREYVREAWRRNSNAQTARDRAALLEAYGGKCQCCGETEPKFLGVDHIHGHRLAPKKEGGSGRSLVQYLKRNGYPKDNFQLLCHNCNSAKGFYGECPHETARRTQDVQV